MRKHLEVGKVVGTHGLKGEVKVFPWCNNADFISDFDKLYIESSDQPLVITSSFVKKNMSVIKIEGIDSIEQAEPLRGKILYIDRDDAKLEDGEYFIEDLIGMNVIDADSKKIYGKLTDVLKTGANDIYQVTNSLGKDYLVPIIPNVVFDVNFDECNIYLRPLKGIFEDAD